MNQYEMNEDALRWNSVCFLIELRRREKPHNDAQRRSNMS